MSQYLRRHSPLVLSLPLALFVLAAGCGGSTGNSTSRAAPPSIDTTTPTVKSTSPADGATGTPQNARIAAAFSEAMDPATINDTTFTLEQGATSIVGTVAYASAGTSAIFTPSALLDASTTYTATITTGAKDLGDNGLVVDFIWSFTTGVGSDVIAPTVNSTNPLNAATGVFVNTSVNATFSEDMDPSTLTGSTFTLVGPGSSTVLASISYDVGSRIATLRPASNLANNALFQARVTTGVEDLAGLGLASDFTWSFTTGAAGAQSQQDVALGAAGAFAVLAGSTVTNVNNPGTKLIGDLGVSPGSDVTGFPPGVVDGTKHVANAAAAQAKLDLTTAYNDAAGRTTAPITVAGNLGGLTLTPGLYKSTSGLEITSGDLTLDANGDANGVFIFQMATTLETTAGRQVVLSGGASAAHIYWQVGTSATIGTNSIFKGNILADQSIALETGAKLEGRALTRIGAVTLDTNAVSAPGR